MVSTLLLNIMTLMKMIAVTRNQWFTRKTVRRTCYCTWTVHLVISIITTVRSDSISARKRQLVLPAITSISFLLQSVSFIKIFVHLRRSRETITPERGAPSDVKFLKIVVFQVVSYITCMAPISIYILLRFFGVARAVGKWVIRIRSSIR